MKWAPWSDAKTNQYRELSNETCSGSGIPSNAKGVYPVKHGLVAVTTRSWRDWFRKRHYWRCHFCDLRVKVVE